MRVGVDAGSSRIKFALLDDEGTAQQLRTHVNVGIEMTLIEKRLGRFLEEHSFSRADVSVGACGYGRGLVADPKNEMTEITALGRGVALAGKMVDAVIDIGAQDFKVLRIDPKKGSVLEFYMNDKCSSGTGAFMHAILERLGISFDQMNEYYALGTESVGLSATCTVFAASEVIEHLSKGVAVDVVLRGAVAALVRKISPLVSRLGAIGNCTLTGGLGLQPCIANAFSSALNIPFITLDHPSYRGAIGAAALAPKAEKAGV